MPHSKLILLFTGIFLSVTSLQAQQTSLNANAYSGFFSFRGEGSASKTAYVQHIPSVPSEFTENRFGNKSAFSYSVELQLQRTTKNKFQFGTSISFEKLSSTVHIDSVISGDLIYTKTAADGKTDLKSSFITIEPFIGKRWMKGKLQIDAQLGTDISFYLTQEEHTELKGNYDYMEVKQNVWGKPTFDFRPRLQLNLEYQRIRFLAGYSHGLINYEVNQYGGKAYSRFIRLGVGYRIW